MWLSALYRTWWLTLLHPEGSFRSDSFGGDDPVDGGGVEVAEYSLPHVVPGTFVW